VSYGGTLLTASYVDSYLGVWGTTYEQIRRVNETLGKLHASGFDEAEKQRFQPEFAPNFAGIQLFAHRNTVRNRESNER